MGETEVQLDAEGYRVSAGTLRDVLGAEEFTAAKTGDFSKVLRAIAKTRPDVGAFLDRRKDIHLGTRGYDWEDLVKLHLTLEKQTNQDVAVENWIRFSENASDYQVVTQIISFITRDDAFRAFKKEFDKQRQPAWVSDDRAQAAPINYVGDVFVPDSERLDRVRMFDTMAKQLATQDEREALRNSLFWYDIFKPNGVAESALHAFAATSPLLNKTPVRPAPIRGPQAQVTISSRLGSENVRAARQDGTSSKTNQAASIRLDIGIEPQPKISQSNVQMPRISSALEQMTTFLGDSQTSLPALRQQTPTSGKMPAPMASKSDSVYDQIGDDGQLIKRTYYDKYGDIVGEQLGPQIQSRTAPNTATTVFRVDETQFTRIEIGEGGKVTIPEVRTKGSQGPERDLFININQEGRAKVFLRTRGKQGKPAVIKSFEVKQSFVDELRKAAVLEEDLAKSPGRPVRVDVNKAPDQYGLKTPEWIQKLRDAIIQGSGKVHE